MITAIFQTNQELAKLFTPRNDHVPDRDGKYLEGGLKPIEAFCSDIQQNLIGWCSPNDESIFYRTKTYIYEFHFNNELNIVEITRFNLDKLGRLDSWANVHSVISFDRSFCRKNMDKYVPLIIKE